MASATKGGTDKRGESESARRKREGRERGRSREAWARTIADNEGIPIEEARERAKDLEKETADFGTAVEEGLVDPETGNPTRKAKRKSATKPKGRPSKSARPRRRRSSTARKVSRAATAPFGSAASAGWSFFSGGLSLILLYVVLREAGAIGAAASGLGAGVRRIGDPYTPLVPSKGEVSSTVTRRKGRSINTPVKRGGRVLVGTGTPGSAQ